MTTHDPHDPGYLDEADVRDELTRVFDVCNGCRQCVDLCGVFPLLFDSLVSHGGDAGRLTPSDQDRIVDQCVHCTRCSFDCPYAPHRDDRAIDVPRLMLRADAMRFEHGHVPRRSAAAARALGRLDTLGSIGTRTSSVSNGVAGARPRSTTRRLLSVATGASAQRVLPPYARQRFSTWFDRRSTNESAQRRAAVTVVPTCLVEYQDPSIGRDLVRIYERNGIECSLSGAGCCGAPSLHAGDLERFTTIAERNVTTLVAEVRGGADLIVAQPTCAHVITTAYPGHVRAQQREDARSVAAHTHEASAYLSTRHRRPDSELDVRFTGDVPDHIAYHAACHVRALGDDLPGRELLELTGASVDVVQGCSGNGSLWGLRSDNDGAAAPLAESLGARIGREMAATAQVVVGDCHVANTTINEETGRTVSHPLQILARAYGFEDDRATP